MANLFTHGMCFEPMYSVALVEEALRIVESTVGYMRLCLVV